MSDMPVVCSRVSVVTTITSDDCFFFFNDTATTEIYTLSLHDALPIFDSWYDEREGRARPIALLLAELEDRKSTRLNSSHITISYAVFCLKKKKQTQLNILTQQKQQQHRKT